MTSSHRTERAPAMSRDAAEPSAEVSVAIICIAPLRNAAILGGTYSAVLGEGLCADGTRVELWTRKSAEMLAELDVPVRQIWRSGALAWLDVLKAVLKIRPRVVHLQHYFFLFGNGAAGELSAMLLMLSLAVLGTRVVVTLHDVPGKEQITAEYVKLHKYDYPAFFVLAGITTLMYLLGKCANEIIVHNELFAGRLVKFGVDPRKINVVPFPLPPSKPVDRSSARETLGLDVAGRVVLFFGYATGYKGIEQLLGAFEILEERGSMVRLLLGAGVHPKMGATPKYAEYYSAMESRARAIGLVNFVGFIDPADLDTYISAADLGILPYVEYHGASGPLYYYLSHQRPVLVSTRISEHTAGLRTGTFGTTPDEIALAICRFFEEEPFAEVVHRECAELRATLFSDAYLTLTREVYSKALNSSFSGAA